MTAAQLELFGPKRRRSPRTYPDAPGAKARETSFEAAAGMAAKAPTLRDRVLAEIRRKPSTPEQVALQLGVPLMNVRPRCSELAKLGLICDSRIRREAMGGRNAIVWAAVTR